MSSNIIPDRELQNNESTNDSLEIATFIGQLKNGIWLVGIPAWIFGITDRTLSAYADSYLSTIEFVNLLTTCFFFLSWLYLKPEPKVNDQGVNATIQSSANEEFECPNRTRKFQLKKRHMISQEYILPFPYVCQIYHLLSLKHLETIHKFSLNNLKILNVSHIQPTPIGGIIKFETILDSPFNPLRIWRQPIVEVDLILHNPYTVELSIPVYNEKRITVIFNALPLRDTEHKFFIDIYSDLEWPKPILQIMLHFASCLTLFEDLPYLRKLAEVNIERLFQVSRASNHETMWLFQRFVELYGSRFDTLKMIEGSY
jgi:hypothetical protein